MGVAPAVEELVRFAAAARPPRRAAARSLFDFCGCVIGGGASEPSWPLDRAGKLALRAHRRDQDDLHLGSGTHPGGVVWSVVCACAGDASVGKALAAASLGYELTVRLGEALAPERQRWHLTAVAGTVGAAGAAARLLGADEADAVGHAVSVAGGSAHVMVERAGTRFLHRAHAASSGVACARAAGSGLRAGRRGIESESGAFAHVSTADALTPRAATGLEETHFRLHPATGFAHAAIDAALTLGPLEPAEVERVTATVPPAVLALASNPAPAGKEEAWWSIEHALAVALAGGEELCGRVELVPGSTGWGATVEVALRDGTLRSASVDRPRAASDGDLHEKWRRLTGEDGSEFFERLLAADDAEPFASLVEILLRPDERR